MSEKKKKCDCYICGDLQGEFIPFKQIPHTLIAFIRHTIEKLNDALVVKDPKMRKMHIKWCIKELLSAYHLAIQFEERQDAAGIAKKAAEEEAEPVQTDLVRTEITQEDVCAALRGEF